MIDFEEHINKKYIPRKCDCWTLIQDLYLEQHHMRLPDFPIGTDEELSEYAFANIKTEEVEVAERGDIVYIIESGQKHHTGYALDKKKFFHRTENGARIDLIPLNASIIRIKGLINEA